MIEKNNINKESEKYIHRSETIKKLTSITINGEKNRKVNLNNLHTTIFFNHPEKV